MDGKTVALLLTITFFQAFPRYTNGIKNVIFAVNAGGDHHIDTHGVHYERDPLQNEGIASDYGMRLHTIGRVDQNDEILYRTERYSLDTFGYDIPVKGDGRYVIVLKFCEVYFGSSGAKVFDVMLNKQHLVVPELDIYAKVGIGMAHDEIIPFEVSNGGKKLVVLGSESAIKNGKIALQFAKGPSDNPKINAFYVVKGSVDDVPRLPAIPNSDDLLFDDDDEDQEIVDPEVFHGSDERVFSLSNRKSSFRRKPAQHDPWEDESSVTVYLPVLGAFGASCCATLLAFIILK